MTNKVKKPLDMTIPELREYVISKEGQKAIVAFMEEKLELINSQELYLSVLDSAESNYTPLTAQKLRAIRSVMNPYRNEASPGHDGFHWDRELINAIALSRDPLIQNAKYKADLDAGLLGAMLHDIGTALISRYTDKNFAAGHCEIGAWLVWHLLEGLVEPNMQLIVWYSINGHQSLTQDTGVAAGPDKQPTYIRKFHVIEPFFMPDDEKAEQPIGIATWLTRAADRLENFGATHLVRHLLAWSDAQEQSNPGDWTGSSVIETKGAQAIITMMKPEYRIDRSFGATVFDWGAGIYGHSVHGAKPYSVHDFRFHYADWLIDRKIAQTFETLDIIDEEPDLRGFDEAEILFRLKALLSRVNGSPYMERSWEHLMVGWNELTVVEKAKWSVVIGFLDKAYTKGLRIAMQFATQIDDQWAKLAKEVFDELEAPMELQKKLMQLSVDNPSGTNSLWAAYEAFTESSK